MGQKGEDTGIRNAAKTGTFGHGQTFISAMGSSLSKVQVIVGKGCLEVAEACSPDRCIW